MVGISRLNQEPRIHEEVRILFQGQKRDATMTRCVIVRREPTRRAGFARDAIANRGREVDGQSVRCAGPRDGIAVVFEGL